MPNAPTVLPIQFTQLSKQDLETEGLPTLNNQLAQLFTRFNQSIGAQGPSPLHAGVDLRGARVQNLGQPVDETDAISQGQANQQFSSPVQRSNLDIGGKYALKGLTAVTFQANQQQQQIAAITTPYVSGTGSMTLPSGVIEKWGHAATPGAVTFATAFPTSCENVIVCDDKASGTAGRASLVSITGGGVGFTCADDQAGNGVWWRAVGS